MRRGEFVKMETYGDVHGDVWVKCPKCGVEERISVGVSRNE
jgi:hypothetical protein